MNHNMSSPCKECPFRTDIKGYLRQDRVQEIAESVLNGYTFPCHKTTESIESEEDGCSDNIAVDSSEECAGAAIFAAKQGKSSQLSRIAHRLGFKVAELDMDAPVCGSTREMLKVHRENVKK